MYKLAVVGDKDSIISFKVLGVDVYPIDFISDTEELTNRIKKVLEHLVVKEYEIKALRLIITAKINKIPNNIIKERMREIYV